MEKGIDSKEQMEHGKEAPGVFSVIRERFGIHEVDIRTYSPLTLAYIGDGIYDLVIRSLIVARGNTRAGRLHSNTSRLVNAHSQSMMMEYLLPVLSTDEETVYRRGRNAHSPTMAKNAAMGDYRRATGFEALMGYLYLANRFDRMLDLVGIGLEGLEKEKLISGENRRGRE